MLIWILLACLWLDALAGSARPAAMVRPLTADGSWCWFSDPRAVFFAGRFRRTYAGWITSRGDIEVCAYDHNSGQIHINTIHHALEIDDHDNPSLLILPDGRIAVFYTRHQGKEMFVKVSTRPEDISQWEPVRVLGFTPDRFGICYSNPVLLSAERNRIYLFWRGLDYKPTWSWSDDLGQSWAQQQKLITSPGARPYLKVDTNAKDTIHLAFTDGHPRDEQTNSIYYMATRSGRFYKADGTQIADINDLPIERRSADVVYDGQKTGVRAWIWDVASDNSSGRPVIVYVRLPESTDHRYHYAFWDGKTWQDLELCSAGRWFPQTPAGRSEPEPHYSGGIVLDHDDPGVVFLSRQVQGADGGPGRFEIEMVSVREGRIVSRRFITSGSDADNVRPVVVRNHQPDGPMVLWLRVGRYRHYTDYQTSIMMGMSVKQ